MISTVLHLPDFLRVILWGTLRYRVRGHNTTKVDRIRDLNYYGNVNVI